MPSAKEPVYSKHLIYLTLAGMSKDKESVRLKGKLTRAVPELPLYTPVADPYRAGQGTGYRGQGHPAKSPTAGQRASTTCHPATGKPSKNKSTPLSLQNCISHSGLWTPYIGRADIAIMLIQETHADVTTTVNGAESPMRIFVFHPTIPQYPNAQVSLPPPLPSPPLRLPSFNPQRETN